MLTSPRRSLAWFCVSLVLGGGCNCGKRTGSNSSGGLVKDTGVLSPKPGTLNFGNVPVNQHAALQLTLTNAGAGEVDIDTQSITGDTTHSFSAQTFAASYAPHQSASAVVSFTPTQAGPLTAQLVFVNDGQTSPVDVTLVGSGIAIDVACTPTAMAFGPVQVGAAPSPTQTFTCVNNGPTASLVTIDAIDTDPQFFVTDSNGPVSSSNAQMLAPGVSYDVTVTFTPAAVGTVSSAFTYTLCANATTCVAAQAVALTGEGVNGFLAISPTPIVFNGVPAGQQAQQTVTLTNIGTNTLQVTCISLDSVGATACGTASSTFSFSGLPSLPVTLATNQTATFTLEYSATGSLTNDQLDVAYQSSGGDPSQATAPITAGSITAPCSLSISPTTLYFGWASVGQSSTLAATLTNNGTSVCNISGVTLDPTSDPSYSVDPSQATNFPIAAGNSATITADFTLNNDNLPNQRTGTIDFQSNDPNYANGTVPLLASLETIGSTCPDDHPNLFTGQTDQGGVCQTDSDCTTGLTCTNSACWLLGETSPIQVVLSWDYAEDLDLHVVEPQAGGPDTERLPDGGTQKGCEIYYGNGVEGATSIFGIPADPDCTPVGELNRDAQAACYAEDVNVEEVTYPAGKTPPAGWYTVRADFWQDCDSQTNQSHGTIPYVVQVRIGGFLESYCGTFSPGDADEGGDGSGVKIFQFQISPDGGLL